ncbi:unnamed protein product [Arabis nemorensis]|uniref:Spt5 KOW domain-containing protein n=1 Tax=Arabis nemorensis TaxID=586526 RepID=A0A565BMJ5_9BRAS|nr:unnamed protein product [Arabis nemorensis]
MGSQTPMHPSRTPLHPYMTPMRDFGAIPIHDGMRTRLHDRAWNPYTPMTLSRWKSGIMGNKSTGNREALTCEHMKHLHLDHDGIVVLIVVITVFLGHQYTVVRSIFMRNQCFDAKLISLDGSDGIVKLDDSLDVKILDLAGYISQVSSCVILCS